MTDSRSNRSVVQLSPGTERLEESQEEVTQVTPPTNGHTPVVGDLPGDRLCSICGTRLGWSMVRRGQTQHRPECPKVVNGRD